MKNFLAILFTFILASCGSPYPNNTDVTVSSNENYETINGIVYEKEHTGYIRIWTDPSTGCRYYIYDGSIYKGGITIRYREDGSPDCPEKDISE